MARQNQESITTFGEVLHSSNISYSQNRFSAIEKVMMKRIAEGATRIFLACGATDFRKQIPGLVAAVTLSFKLDPYNGDYVFIFCNRKRDSIKVLRYD